MKGVILAGGTGSRLLPLTRVTNKHLLPIGHEPMIFHPIRKLVEAGITDIMVITGAEHAGDIIATLGSGKDFNCSLTYRVQDRAGGIAEALGLAEAFAGDSSICVLLADNIFEDRLDPFIDQYCGHCEERGGIFNAMVVLKKVDDPQRFGVAKVDNGYIISIEEKPKQPESDLAVTGIYIYDNNVFKIIKKLTPSSRGELEITDVNNAYLCRERDSFLIYATMKGWWTDAGTHESFVRANKLVNG